MKELGLDKYKKPNVIWIICDQLRADTFGYRNNPNVNTPNIDNLARNGMRYDNAVSGNPWCAPFRAALLTSKYSHQNGVVRTPCLMNPKLPTIAQPFKMSGYHTAWIGKWHLDGSNSHNHYVEKDRRGGFDYWVGYENNNNQNETYIYGTGCEKPQRLNKYETDGLTDVFIEHLSNHIGGKSEYQPFFATLSVQPPHSPYVPPTDTDGTCRYYKNPCDMKMPPNVPHSKNVMDKAKFDMAGYCGMVENIDMNVGRVRMALKKMGIDKETYIIFMSDHGDCLGSHGQWEKSSPWEESIRIPFVVSTLGGYFHMKTGKSESLVNHVDIAPTTLGLCNIKAPDWMVGYDYSSQCKIDSRNELPDNEEQEPDSVYLQHLVRKHHPNSVNRAWRAVLMNDGYKYVCTPNNDWLLFDTINDPFEMNNLCYNILFQEKKEECHKRLEQWIEDTGDEFELPDITLN